MDGQLDPDKPEHRELLKIGLRNAGRSAGWQVRVVSTFWGGLSSVLLVATLCAIVLRWVGVI